MRRSLAIALSLGLTALSLPTLTACGGDPEPADGGTPPGTDGGTPPGTDGGTPPGTDGGTPPGTDGGTPPTGGWALHTHPCSGNRTDTLWVDADGAAFVGCGSTTSGDQGFYLSTDGGETWEAPTTTPSNYFAAWRVWDISRSADGLLYVAGRNTGNSHRVVSVDTSSTPWAVELVLESQPTVGFSFEVGGFRRNGAGRAIAESSTGTDILVRGNDAGDWMDGSAWDDAEGGLQILQLEEHGGRFFGAGSTISKPPYLFISQPPGSGFGFQIIQLATGIGEFSGEMWGVDADDTGIVIGGVDQDRNAGMVYALPPDGSSSLALDVSTLYPDDPTWIRGVCRNGDHLVAVGELSMRGDGIVLESSDDGVTWNAIGPEDTAVAPFPSVHRCHAFDDGTIWVAGANGVFAVHTPE